MPKTGSTALQVFLEGNEEYLSSRNAGYYSCKHRYVTWPGPSNGDFLMYEALRLLGEEIGDKRVRHLDEECVRFREYARGFDTLILSEETFYRKEVYEPELACAYWQAVKDALASLLGEEPQIDILIYLRRQDKWVESHWREELKGRWGEVLPFDEYAQEKAQILDYDAVLRGIEDVFGIEHVVVRVYERGRLVEGDIAHDFMSVMGFGWDDSLWVEPKAMNPSLNLREAYALYLLSKGALRTRLSLWPLIKAADDIGGAHPEASNARAMDADDRYAYLRRFEAGNRSVARRYFDSEELFGADETDPAVVKPDLAKDLDAAIEILKEANRSRCERVSGWRRVKAQLAGWREIALAKLSASQLKRRGV